MKLPQPSLLGLFLLVVGALWLCPIGSVSGEEKEAPFAPGALGIKVPVITDAKQRDEFIGRLVAVRGVVKEGKRTSICGVAINCPKELQGKEAYAVGILGRFTVKKANPLIPNDGPGVKYTLYFDLRGKLAEARPIPLAHARESVPAAE
jgi:hypothetical protein